MPGKLGMTTTQRMAVLRNQASNLLWYGRIETTLGRAKELRPYVEKIITLAMNTYEDTVESTVTTKDKKGKEVVRPYVGIGMLDITDEYVLWQIKFTTQFNILT